MVVRRVALLGVCLVAVLLMSLAAAAEIDSSGQWKYVVEDGGAVVTGYIVKPSGDLLIPDELDGYVVAGIGNRVFSWDSITSVTIPDSVTHIGDSAFSYCKDLISVTIPDSVTRIGDDAFTGCSALASVTIPASVTSVGMNPFADTALTSINVSPGNPIYADVEGVLFAKQQNMLVSYPSAREGAYTIPEGVLFISDFAFYRCNGLTNVTIPDSVMSIGDNAFSGCSGLTSVMIPDSVTSIGNMAFSGCSGLTGVTIPDSVTSIGVNPFYNSALVSISVSPGNPTYIHIDGVLFDKQREMLVSYPGSRTGTYAIPEGVLTIGNSAFGWCSGLTSVTIPDSVTGIGNNAFALCQGLTSVIIPDSVVSIGRYAFFQCRGLTAIDIPASVKSIDEWTFSYCSGLTSVTIPDSVTIIDSWAFGGCSSLTNVTIPASVVQIGRDAFYTRGDLTLTVTGGSHAELYAILNNLPYIYITDEP